MAFCTRRTDTSRPRAGLLLVATLSIAGCAGVQPRPVFTSDVTSDPRPWTHLDFRNDQDAFQFAIVTDRTGGLRPGIFPLAVERLNWLQPEFVISVGDLIEGYTDDPAILAGQWEEFEQFAATFEMPFFYVAGNHDVTNDAMLDLWRRKFGRTHYSFVYRDVLFLCLDTQDGMQQEGQSNYTTGLSEGQILYAEDVLERHRDVHWTLVFMHQPLWDYTDDEAVSTQFARLADLLDSRHHTVFAGHFHHYVKFERDDDHSYYHFATTGGGSALRGPLFGELDHVVWVTMTPDGPRLANLTLEGILPDDFRTEAGVERLETLMRGMAKMEAEPIESDTGHAGVLSLNVQNRYPQGLQLDVAWDGMDSPWVVEPAQQDITVNAGDDGRMVWKVHLPETEATVIDRQYAFPVATISARLPDRDLLDAVELSGHAGMMQLLPVLSCTPLESPPRIDGILDDPPWQEEPTIPRLYAPALDYEPSHPTRAWLAYDDRALYVAVHCAEDDWNSVRRNVTDHDNSVWEDDSIEIFIDAAFSRETYFQLIMNTEGVTLDKNNGTEQWEGEYDLQVKRADNAWTAEFAIPWKTVGRDLPPEPEERIGVMIQRNRPRDGRDERLVCVPTFGEAWLHPERFAIVQF